MSICKHLIVTYITSIDLKEANKEMAIREYDLRFGHGFAGYFS